MIRVKPLRIAFTGASGTGKTTLARWVSETYNLPMNPVGSRSVAQSMGFTSPYDVDAAGKRLEFQERLLTEKGLWEQAHPEGFVTDRSTLDNLTYSTMHGAQNLSREYFDQAYVSHANYTLVFPLTVSAFRSKEEDAARLSDENYHQVYERILGAYLDAYELNLGTSPAQDYSVTIQVGLEARKQALADAIDRYLL